MVDHDGYSCSDKVKFKMIHSLHPDIRSPSGMAISRSYPRHLVKFREKEKKKKKHLPPFFKRRRNFL